MIKILSAIGLGLYSIRTRFFHTLFSLSGIVIGVAALVSILALIDGVEQYVRDQITTTSDLKSITVRAEQLKFVDGVFIRKDTLNVLTPRDFVALKYSLTYPVTGHLFMTETREIRIDTNKFSTVAQVTGLLEPRKDDVALAGRTLTEDDVRNAAPVAVLTPSLGQALTGKQYPDSLVGKNIVLGNRQLAIVGIIGEKGDAPRHEMLFPITIFSPAELRKHPPYCTFEAMHVEDVPILKNQIETWLAERFRNSDDFRIITKDVRAQQAAKGFKLFWLGVILVIGVAVFIGGIGVMNIILISVNDRTWEIGLRRLFGARKRDILLQFLFEAIATSLFGVFTGILLGILATKIIIRVAARFAEIHFHPTYTWEMCSIIAIPAVVVGLVFGAYPAIRAARLNPLKAIGRGR